jgi:hypothetical protein
MQEIQANIGPAGEVARVAGEQAAALDGQLVALSNSTVAKTMEEIQAGITKASDAAIIAAREADTLKGKLDAINNTTVAVNFKWNVPPMPNIPGAHELPKAQAAGGASSGGYTLVGEQGPELVNLPAGARVLSNPVTNNVYNNYNLTMHTRAQASTVRQDFALMRAMG